MTTFRMVVAVLCGVLAVSPLAIWLISLAGFDPFNFDQGDPDEQ